MYVLQAICDKMDSYNLGFQRCMNHASYNEFFQRSTKLGSYTVASYTVEN